jgi:hypothetical protein
MEIIKFILFAFLLIAAWSYVIIPSYLDAARDQLFDLRDELRSKFISNGWDISSDKYAEARTVVNSYLRFTEETTFWKLVYIHFVVLSQRTAASKIEAANKNRRLSDVQTEEDVFISKLRQRALHVVIGYAVSTSFFLNMFVVAYLPIYACNKMLDVAGSGVKNFFSAAWHAVVNLPEVVVAGYTFGERYIGHVIFRESVVEQYSTRYRYSH